VPGAVDVIDGGVVETLDGEAVEQAQEAFPVQHVELDPRPLA